MIKQTYRIKAPVEKVWRALTDPEIINAWGGGPARMDDKKGTRFELWDGSIYGTNIEVAPKKKLVQHWFSDEWREPSLVTFTLTDDDGTTTLVLQHEDVPREEIADIREGWRIYYLGPMKKYLETSEKRKPASS